MALHLPAFLQGFHALCPETDYSTMLPNLHQHLLKYGATVALSELEDEEIEPQSKKPRIGGSHPGNPQARGLQLPLDPDSSYLGLDADGDDHDNNEDMDDCTGHVLQTARVAVDAEVV